MTKYINTASVKLALAFGVGYYIGKNNWTFNLSVGRGDK